MRCLDACHAPHTMYSPCTSSGVPAEVGGGPEGQMANDHAVGFAPVLVYQDHLRSGFFDSSPQQQLQLDT